MKLLTWLELSKVSVREFAKMIGKNQSLVHKYVYEETIPGSKAMLKIYTVTKGAVDANIFFKLSDQIFEEELKNKKNPPKPEIDFSY
ncbi:hypothetical protein [Candidatus Tisiphia endosymbiont of Oplodontha viridula]|uniref:hypothetical protein n=1 Tax=Candidatus Tisiphia endosymbiont of Oplodontha viridula TaxID=3077925 RepID=UPI0035C8FAC6